LAERDRRLLLSGQSARLAETGRSSRLYSVGLEAIRPLWLKGVPQTSPISGERFAPHQLRLLRSGIAGIIKRTASAVGSRTAS